MTGSAENGFKSSHRSAQQGFTFMRRFAEHGFTFVRRFAEHGFTLIELVVALFVFGLLAAAGVSLLAGSVRAQAGATLRLDDVARERRLTAILTSDLLQVLPRVTRSTTGAVEPSFRGGNGPLLLTFVRGGWSNGDDAARASIQRVEITRQGTRLMRSARPMADGTAVAAPVILLDDVAQIQLRFREKGEWVDVWNPTRESALPRAVELIITRTGASPLRRLFIVGTGY